MVFDKERQLEFIDLNVDAYVRGVDRCSSFSHILRDGIYANLSEAIEAGYVTFKEFHEKYWRKISNASGKFDDNCKCGIIKK